MDLLRGKEMVDQAKAADAQATLLRAAEEEGNMAPLANLPLLPATTGSSPSHEFSFTISFHSPSAAAKSPSALGSRGSTFDLAPADDIFFHGHLLPLQLLSRPPLTSSPRSLRGAPSGGRQGERDGEQSRGGTRTHSATNTAITNTSSSCSSSFSAASSSIGDAKERGNRRFLSALFTGKWRKGGDAAEREEDDNEKKRATRAFDAMSRLLRRYLSAAFRSGRAGGRGEPLRRRRPYSFAGNPTPGAAVGRAEEWRRRRGELSAPASMRTSPSNSGLLVAPAGTVGASSEESTMEELRSAIEAAIIHCKSSVATKDEKCKC